MIRKIILSIGLSAFVFAVEFNTFLNEALAKSAYIKSSLVLNKQAKEEQSRILRYDNPDFELESSKFSPSGNKAKNGYRASISQPIRLWGVTDDRQSLASAKIENSVTKTFAIKADFIRNLSLLFTNYSKDKDLFNLSKEEEKIAKKIFDISKERFKNGTISRGTMLQAKIAYEMILSRNIALNLKSQKSYFTLLQYSGLNKEIELNSNYTFNIIGESSSTNPTLLTLMSEQKISLATSKLASNKIETFGLITEFEKEPEQDIYRVAVSVPIPIFNQKKEEQTIAKLESKKQGLLIQNEENKLALNISYLKRERILLLKLLHRNRVMIRDEESLLSMFEEAYKIASVNLLELQDIKNRVIRTKKSLIENKIALNQNAIKQNYLQGAYNE